MSSSYREKKSKNNKMQGLSFLFSFVVFIVWIGKLMEILYRDDKYFYHSEYVKKTLNTSSIIENIYI